MQGLQSELEAVTAAKDVVERAVERQRAELDREAQFRADTEEKWLSQVEEYQQKVRVVICVGKRAEAATGLMITISSCD